MDWGQWNQEVVFFCGLITAYCAYTDWRYRKIYNYVTFPFFLIAVLFVVFLLPEHVPDAAKAFAAVMAIFIPLYLLRIVGAGDVKLLLGLAVLFGLQSSFNFVVRTFFVGAVIGILQILWDGGFLEYLSQIKQSLVSLIMPGLSFHWPSFKKLHYMPFGVVIFISYISGYVL